MSNILDPAEPAPEGTTYPWLSRADWAAGHVKPTGRSWPAIIIMALVWNAFCLGFGYLAYPNVRERVAAGEYLILLTLLFPLLGVGLLINAVRSTINGRRLGRMWFELKTVPASTGQYLGGVIHSDHELNMRDGVRLTLTCVKERLTVARGAKGQSSQQLTVAPEWSETQVLDRELLEHDRQRTALPVYFRLPRDVPGTQKRVGPVGHYWLLEVSFDKAKRAGLLSSVTFDVPVFKTAASDRPFEGPAGADPTAEFKSDRPLIETPAQQGVRVSASRRGGTVFTFQAPDAIRGPGCTVTLLIMALIAAAAAWQLWKPQGSIQFALGAAFICALLLLALNYILYHVNRVTFDVGEVEYEHTLFGVGIRKKVEPSLVASVKPERDTRDAREMFWDVPLVLLEEKADGRAYKKRHTLMRGLPQETAEIVSQQLAEALSSSLVGKKREFRVASGPDPAIAERQMRIMGRVSRTIAVIAATVAGFVAWQILYVDSVKRRETEPYRFGVATLQASSPAGDALGRPIKEGWFIRGSFDDPGPDTGWANLDVPVSGPRAKGMLTVQANKRDGQWVYTRVALLVDDSSEDMNLLPSLPDGTLEQ